MESLGEVIGIDRLDLTDRDPGFCINLNVKEGWVTSIALNSEDGILPTQIIEVDYDTLPFRCRSCLSWKHKVKDCREASRLSKGAKQPPQVTQKQPQERNKGIVLGQEGYQQVRNKRSIRRNIFEEQEEKKEE